MDMWKRHTMQERRKERNVKKAAESRELNIMSSKNGNNKYFTLHGNSRGQSSIILDPGWWLQAFDSLLKYILNKLFRVGELEEELKSLSLNLNHVHVIC